MSDNVKYSYFCKGYSAQYKDAPHTGPIPPHTHNAVEFCLFLSDMQGILLGTSIVPSKKNTLLIFPEYSVHSARSYPGESYKCYVLTVNSNILKSVLEDNYGHYEYLRDSQNPLMIPLNDTDCERLFNSMKRLEDSQNEPIFNQASHLFETLALIDELVPDNKISKPNTDHLSVSNKTVNCIIEYISNNLSEPLQVKDIADKLYLSADYISKIFKKYTGTTITNYITMQRISLSRKLLSEGYSVPEVQEKMGYSSYSYFFRTFKKLVGKTPKEFAMQFKN